MQADGLAAVSSDAALAGRDRRTSFGLRAAASQTCSARLAGLLSRALSSSRAARPSLAAAASALAYQTQLQAAAVAQLGKSAKSGRPAGWRLLTCGSGKRPGSMARQWAGRAGPLAACAALFQVLQQASMGRPQPTPGLLISSNSGGSQARCAADRSRAGAALQGAAKTLAMEDASLGLHVLTQAPSCPALSAQAAQRLAGDCHGARLSGCVLTRPR